MAIRQKQMLYIGKHRTESFSSSTSTADSARSGYDPLTPDDIAEVVVFAAGRRENVVIADTLVFPQHQGSATIMHRKPT